MKDKKVQLPHTFNVGDLCATQDKKLVVITEVKSHEYKFMELQDTYIECIGQDFNIKKGDIVSQPFSVFDEYHYKFQPFK